MKGERGHDRAVGVGSGRAEEGRPKADHSVGVLRGSGGRRDYWRGGSRSGGKEYEPAHMWTMIGGCKAADSHARTRPANDCMLSSHARGDDYCSTTTSAGGARIDLCLGGAPLANHPVLVRGVAGAASWRTTQRNVEERFRIFRNPRWAMLDVQYAATPTCVANDAGTHRRRWR